MRARTVPVVLLLVAVALLPAATPLSAPESGSWIVHFRDAADAAAVRALGFEVVYAYASIPAVWATGSAVDLPRLAALPSVAWIEEDRPLVYDLYHSVAEIGARAGARTPGVWQGLGVDGTGVVVAVVDSGIDATHPDLPAGSKVVRNVKITQLVVQGVGDSFNYPNGDWASGHGTHVAGIVAGTGAASGGTTAGVAPGAKLVGIGAGEFNSVAFAVAGLDWAWKNKEALGIRVVTNSWSVSGGSQYNPTGAIEMTTKRLYDKNVVVVFSAGNNGPNGDRLSGYAMSPYAIGVASYNDWSYTVSDFSSRGDPAKQDLSTKLLQRRPDIAAPGESIMSAASQTPGYANAFGRVPGVIDYIPQSGTSMSAPHVAGASALVIEALLDKGCGTYKPDDVWTALYRTARPDLRLPDGSASAPYERGWGALDAYAAVQLVQNMSGCAVASAGDVPTLAAPLAKVRGEIHLYRPFVDPFAIARELTIGVPNELVSIQSRFTRSLDAGYPLATTTTGTLTIRDAANAAVFTRPVTGSAESDGSFGYSSGTFLFPALPAGRYTAHVVLDTGGGAEVPEPLPIRVLV